ncbi:MAG TPA: endonuclease domain-containing protein [Geomonas sp.]|nr:endonuclease domain-containing protein [Geomonas sp.]
MQGQTSDKIATNHLPQKLRREQTDAERKLWQVLRDRQLSGLKFRRQHPFGNFILDCVCLEKKLIVEVDGGQHNQQAEDDQKRSEALAKAGFTVLRFWNNEVLQELDAVMERILLVAEGLQPHPHPGPPLEGEGEPK